MKNISLSKINIKFNTNIVLICALVVLLVVEGFVVKRSVSVLYQSKFGDPQAKPVTSVRINFGAYDQAVNKVEKGPSYVPQNFVGTNPFQKVEKVK